jgi:uncharacterized protein YndB with AHSA1/START domain
MDRSPTEPRRNPHAATLVVRRRICATREELFAAWTKTEVLIHWWGSRDLSCSAADVDWRVGGSFRIANQYPDGSIAWTRGIFERIDVPFQLEYSWERESQSKRSELVTVRFEERKGSTEIVIIHQYIADEEARTKREHEWADRLDGLVAYAGHVLAVDREGASKARIQGPSTPQTACIPRFQDDTIVNCCTPVVHTSPATTAERRHTWSGRRV